VHGTPGQQSALVVQVLPVGTQVPSHLLLTHGLPQQSALVAHVVPGGGGFCVQSEATIRQRGMPSASCRQQFAGSLLQ
jgi:hypothetical protein